MGASEPDPACRAAVQAAHPYLSAGAFPTCATSPAATTGAQRCDLAFWGFPCVRYSGLNRSVTPADLEQSLQTFESALSHVRLHSPSAFLLENVTRLLSPALSSVWGRIVSALASLPGYHWSAAVLCPSQYGGQMTRPRLYILGLRSGDCPARPPMRLHSASTTFTSTEYPHH